MLLRVDGRAVAALPTSIFDFKALPHQVGDLPGRQVVQQFKSNVALFGQAAIVLAHLAAVRFLERLLVIFPAVAGRNPRDVELVFFVSAITGSFGGVDQDVPRGGIRFDGPENERALWER